MDIKGSMGLDQRVFSYLPIFSLEKMKLGGEILSGRWGLLSGKECWNQTLVVHLYTKVVCSFHELIHGPGLSTNNSEVGEPWARLVSSPEWVIINKT